MRHGPPSSRPLALAPAPTPAAPTPALTRAAIEGVLQSGRHLLVQGAMGVHVSDGLAGKVAAAKSARFVGVGTVSAVGKTPEKLRAELRRAKADAAGGYVGVNLMAAINKDDFEQLARTALEEGVCFIVQGAGISRDIIRWCRDAGDARSPGSSRPAASPRCTRSGAPTGWWPRAPRPAATSATSTIPSPTLVEEVCAATSLPVVAAGGVTPPTWARYFAQGAAGVQLATRFIASSDGDAHPTFKQVHLGKKAEDVVIITSCVKGMKARAVRNEFTEAPGGRASLPAPLEGVVLRPGRLTWAARRPASSAWPRGSASAGRATSRRASASPTRCCARRPRRRGARPLLHRPERHADPRAKREGPEDRAGARRGPGARGGRVGRKRGVEPALRSG